MTVRELNLTPDELHMYRKLHVLLSGNSGKHQYMLEELADSLLYRAPEGYALVEKPKLKNKGVPTWRPAA